MLLTDLLKQNAKKYPNDVALVELNPEPDESKNLEWKEYDLVETGHSVHYRKELTWEGFDKLSDYFAILLKYNNIKKNQKVGILLMNSIDWLPIYFGILKTGAIAVPLNYRYTEQEIEYCLNLADCNTLVFGDEFTERIVKIKRNLKKTKNFIFVGIRRPKWALSFEKEIYSIAESIKLVPIKNSFFPKLTPEDEAAIYFSSGTTGFPKAILHRHGALEHSAIVEQKHHLQAKDDIFLLLPPLYHTGAKMHWFGSLISGSKTIILKGIQPEWIISICASENVSILWLLVPWALDILQLLEKDKAILKKYDLSNLRLMHIGAGPVPPPLVKRWLSIFPKHKYDTNYGLSESIGPGCVHLGMDNVHKVGSIGKAGFGWQTKIVDTEGKNVKQGEVGELAVKGAGNMICYYKNKKATDEVFDGKWLLTGDMAREDEDGFIYLVDRKKDVIISGGENIYPVQIEDFYHSHEAVKDVAVIGLSDERLGEIAAAIIEVKDEVKLSAKIKNELKEYSENLPKYKRPRQFFFDKVLRNPTGKIEKPKLRDIYAKGFE